MAVASAIGVTEVEPSSVAEEVAHLLWEQRHWQKRTLDECRRLWAWRYTSLSDRQARVWVARDPASGRLVGHIAIYPRKWRIGKTVIHGIIPGDLHVHKDWRRHGLGLWLIAIPRKLVVEGEFELVVVTSNHLSHAIGVRLGQRDLGALQEAVDLRSARSALSRRFRGGGRLGLLLDPLLRLRRWLLRPVVRGVADEYEVIRFDPGNTLVLDRSHWTYDPDRLVSFDAEEFIERRFLHDPFQPRTLYQIRSRRAGCLEGYVIVETCERRASVSACAVNAGRLSEALAIALVGERLPREVEAYVVATQPGSVVASELRSLGFLDRGSAAPDLAVHVTAHWLDSHPCATQLGQAKNWSVYGGWTDA